MCCVNKRFYKKPKNKVGKGWKVYNEDEIFPLKVKSEWTNFFDYYPRNKWVKAKEQPFQIFENKKVAKLWSMWGGGTTLILPVRFKKQEGVADSIIWCVKFCKNGAKSICKKTKNSIILAREIFVPKDKK